MNTTALKVLKDLMATSTPSGYEQPGQAVIRSYMKKYADSVTTDVSGNVHGILNPGVKIKVMLAGHCDEIGLMIMHVDDKGFIYFTGVGGVNVPLLQGERVTIHSKKGPVAGVIGVKPIHLMTPKERESGADKIHDLWIDIGAKNKKDALKSVELGDVATINSGWTELKNGIVACRGFDDRIGAFIIADVLRLLSGKRINAEVHAVSTVQEELGLRGAKTASFGINPDIGIAVDVGFATDTPGVNARMVGEAKLGSGPIIHCGPNFNPKLLSMVQDAAKKARIKTQMQPIPRGSGTDANAMQVNGSGAAAALISVPNRHMHSPVELIHIRDVEDSVRLIAATILEIKTRVNLIP